MSAWKRGFPPPQDFELKLLLLKDETHLTAWWSDSAKQWEPADNCRVYQDCDENHDLFPVKHDDVVAWLDIPTPPEVK